MRPKEFVAKLEPKKYPFPTCRCPACGGMGTHCDGMLSISATEVRHRPSTRCHACKGKGLVRYDAIEDDK